MFTEELLEGPELAKLEKCDVLTSLYQVEGIGRHGKLSAAQLSH